MRVYPFFLQKTKAKANSTERLFYENELNVDSRKKIIFYFCSCLWVKINFKFWSNHVLSTESKACTACLHALHSWTLSPWKITTAELYLWWENTHYFSAVTIESEQQMMLFLWIGSQNYRVFLCGCGYRSVGGDMVWIKCWACHIYSTVMVVK